MLAIDRESAGPGRACAENRLHRLQSHTPRLPFQFDVLDFLP